MIGTLHRPFKFYVGTYKRRGEGIRRRPVHRLSASEAAPLDATVPQSCPSMKSDSDHVHELKVIGIGGRGISAMLKLTGSPSSDLGPSFWAIDSDKKNLSTLSSGIQVIDIQHCDDATLGLQDLSRLGSTAVLPKVNAQDCHKSKQGITFVLGSSSSSPGGATLMLQVVNHLHRCGHFVGVALTRPFLFEGARKVEQADALVEALEEVASLVVVIDQNVLTRASSDLTMSEASSIADNTLEYTVRSLLWALRAPEILKVTHGSYVWHGRDLRLMKRPLFPPMMQLISCPGIGNLGRGRAALPWEALLQAGLPSALSTLAEDAVKAASYSPFLEGKVSSCTAALCVLLLPASFMDLPLLQQSLPELTEHQREFAVRSAMQVAAMTVQQLAGEQCYDIIVCPQVKGIDEEDHRHKSGSGSALPAHKSGSGSALPAEAGSITIECSLMLLEALEDAASTRPGCDQSAGKQSPEARPQDNAKSPMQRLGLSRNSQRSSGSSSSKLPVASIQGSTPRMPVLGYAGSTAAPSEASGHTSPPSTSDAHGVGAHGHVDSVNADKKGLGSPAGLASSRTPAVRSAAGSRMKGSSHWNAMSMIAGGGMAPHNPPRETLKSKLPELWSSSQKPLMQLSDRGLQGAAAPAPKKLLPQRYDMLQHQAGDRPLGSTDDTQSASLNGSKPSQLRNPGGSQNTKPAAPRMADHLASTMVAESLDLPPKAAKWRQQQQQRQGSNSTEAPDENDLIANPEVVNVTANGVNVRARVAGMLEKEREV
ncbi:hypothetical protein CEUSTIGMA_g10856.t1 [Chlamydomonas eustigma]|uniref:Tubulin/FtsZ GTPase domain-containing protein n=1 Tax=Chlamydomonas eustigma TaxID=1157962 RepID=A0A250XK15_9CHLO|nr:hypothetical protein CEUSTIGMA_g10856.t1 [Chlamydomonas eustigma]|eukprot:GAX83431.1 hypothetical protein CEUSTIGMA_g10856.t1 [Chlamydomonas eustigma]